jgi:hypothetical protein
MKAPSDFEHDEHCGCPECHPEWWPAPTADADLMYDGADPMDL